MAASHVEFKEYLQEQIRQYDGVSVPVKANLMERIFVRRVAYRNLHPNPGDEFCMPGIGPNYEIISNYEKQIGNAKKHRDNSYFEERLIVEKIRPDGYMILNGHHRWAAAVRMNLRKIPVKIVNLTQRMDVERMLRNSKHDKRVAMDLDEVLIDTGRDANAGKPLNGMQGKISRERLRLGVPALFHYLRTHGYDIWLYTSRYATAESIQRFFRWQHAGVDGVVTGIGKKDRNAEEERKKMEKLIWDKYRQTIHIDAHSVVRIDCRTREFDERRLSDSSAAWSREVMDALKEFDQDAE